MESTLRLTGPLDPRSAWRASPDRCPIARALAVMSTRSAFLIMREAFYGTTRFDDFAARVGISEPVTATRLRELVDQGLLYRVRGRGTFVRTGPPTEGFVVIVDGHFKSEFDTVEAAAASGRKLKSAYPMLQIEIYDAATRVRTLLS